MKIVSFVATKGGTGKTTLAFATALEAANHGSVYIVDLDPQRSLTGLCERRAIDNEDTGNPALLADIVSLENAIATLKRTDFERDFIIVDTPGSMMPIIKSAIACADCVVLPVQQSPLDLLAQEDAAQLIREMGKRDQSLFVMSRIDGKSSVADLRRRIEPLSPNPPVKTHQRLAYARALIAGKSGQEINADCAHEIETLWEAIAKVLNKGN